MKDKLWKYILAVIAFILVYFIAPILIAIILNLTNFIIPKAYQNSDEWINVLSTAVSVYLSLETVDHIVPNSKKFSIIISIICAVYSISVGVGNYCLGTTKIINMISMIIGGVIAIYHIIQLSK